MPQKSTEHLYAQTAAFAAEQEYPHDEVLAGKIGHTALLLHSGQPVVSEGEGWEGTAVQHTFVPSDLRDFLRKADPETREDIQFLAERGEAYSHYWASVETVLAAAETGSVSVLGKGNYGKTYQFEQDGNEHVVKTGGVRYVHARAFRLAKDISHVAHLEAVDLAEGRTVMNLVPGTPVDRLPLGERVAIPQEHITGLIDKALELHDAGIEVDTKGSNFPYDPQEGFGVIDYLPAGYRPGGERKDRPQTKAEMVIRLAHTLTEQPTRYYIAEMPERGMPAFAEWNRERKGQVVSVLTTYLDVLESQYPDILDEAAAGQAALDQLKTPGSSPSIIYDIRELPAGEAFDAFADRLSRLGLRGTVPRSYFNSSNPVDNK